MTRATEDLSCIVWKQRLSSLILGSIWAGNLIVSKIDWKHVSFSTPANWRSRLDPLTTSSLSSRFWTSWLAVGRFRIFSTSFVSWWIVWSFPTPADGRSWLIFLTISSLPSRFEFSIWVREGFGLLQVPWLDGGLFYLFQRQQSEGPGWLLWPLLVFPQDF